MKSEISGEEDPRWPRAVTALNRGDSSAAIEIFRQLAEEGDSRASLSLGHIHEALGDLDPLQYHLAAQWYTRALSDQPYPSAHLGLARIYFYGLGRDQDKALARQHLELSYPEDTPEAAIMLAIIFDRQDAAPQDFARARSLYELAAGKGYPYAMKRLSRMLNSEGRWLAAIRLSWRGIVTLAKLRVRNPRDVRLIGFLPSKSPSQK